VVTADGDSLDASVPADVDSLEVLAADVLVVVACRFAADVRAGSFPEASCT